MTPEEHGAMMTVKCPKCNAMPIHECKRPRSRKTRGIHAERVTEYRNRLDGQEKK